MSSPGRNDKDKHHHHKDDARRGTNITTPLEEERNRDIAAAPRLPRNDPLRDYDDDERDNRFGSGRYTGPPDIGSADLNPFGSRGSGHGTGGMVLDPRDLNPARNPDHYQPHGPGGRVPHARFDPFGPPELGPQFGSRNPPAPRGRGPPGGRGNPFGPSGLGFGAGPNNDHFKPPPDMFM